MDKLMSCPKCNKNMIQRFSHTVLLNYPPQYPWNWWCGCGHTEVGGIERGKTHEEVAMDAWEKANG